jgi:dTMP kinase
VLLDLDVESGLARVEARSGQAETDRFESETLDFHNRVRQGYRDIASLEPDRIKVVQADAAVEAVQERIRAIVEEFLETKVGVRDN